MSKRLTTEQFIEKARQVHGTKYDYSETIYVDSRTKLDIICPEHGRFTQLAASHLQGNGCPDCAKIWSDSHRRNLQISSRKSRGMSTEEWVERARSIHGDKYDYSQTIYVNQRTNVKIICPIHGLFEQKADSHIRGNGCRLCGLQSEGRKGVHGWSDEQREKIANTCLKKYGVARYLDSDEGKVQIAKIKSDIGFRQKMSNIIASDSVQEKIKRTCLEKYGVEYPAQSSEVFEKISQSKVKNGTWSTSKPEILMHEMLCNKFGVLDVEQHYNKDFRYPFHCDCYVKSWDLFIELNATWTHGNHWFDCNNPIDVEKSLLWLKKSDEGHPFYKSAYRIWTYTDLQKRDTAIRNNLNYLVFWDNDLSDFKSWLNSDSLVLNNIY